MNIQDFVKDLSNTNISGSVYNQYKNKIRCKNLQLYLKEMKQIKPKYILIGEAPGYQGCRLTGVPFTSEFILLNGVNKLNLFGKSKGYKKTQEKALIQKEKTALILWETLTEINKIPLLWNAFPFHPFKHGNPNSNRKPLKNELLIGERFLRDLINLFNIKNIIAVGNTSKIVLDDLGLNAIKVRHPSHGGKSEFKKQLTKLLN